MGFCASKGYRQDKDETANLFTSLVSQLQDNASSNQYSNLFNSKTGYATNYTPTTYTSPDVEDIYKGVAQSGAEGVKSGLQTSNQNLASSMGQRGLLGSGINLKAGQQTGATAADKIANIYQNAAEQGGLLQSQYDYQTQQLNDASKQAAAQLGLSAATTQKSLSNQDIQNLMSLYLGGLQNAGTTQPGWGSSLFGGIAGLGASALSGGALGSGGYLTGLLS